MIKRLGVEFSIAELPMKGATSCSINKASNLVYEEALSLWYTVASSLLKARGNVGECHPTVII